jgi:selenocysteine-specific elongation factor
MDIIVGTAGHIDHGKTALVKALTGTDADRLPEEKERGITIDLGFAELSLGDIRIGFVDVPGHERFVKNMLAGASGLDLVLLVVAADEGVKPQTREHFEICRLLNTQAGVIVITKKDLVDEETLELARLDILELVEGSFLASAEVIAVSSRTGEGIEELKQALISGARLVPKRNDHYVSRLSVDRSFSIKGHGAVVTGTVAAGEFREGSEIELLPVGLSIRVRGLQSHGKQVASVHAGQRAAINIAGLNSSDVFRGMVLAENGVLSPAQMIDTEVEVLASAKRPLRSRQRVRISIGTIEALARVQVLNDEGEIEPGSKDLVQFSIENPIVAVSGERFIIRSYSPQTTIAGGFVIDPLANRHRRKDIDEARQFLQKLRVADDDATRLKLILDMDGESGITFHRLQARTGIRKEFLLSALSQCIDGRSAIQAHDRYIGRAAFERLKAKVIEFTSEHHRLEPLSKGMSRETLREKIFAHLDPAIFRAVLGSLEKEHAIISESETVRLAAYSLSLSPADAEIRKRLERTYNTAGFEVPKLDDALAEAIAGMRSSRDNARKVFQLLLNEGVVVKISDDFYFSKHAIERLKKSLRMYAESTTGRLIDVSKFKEIAGVSRKYAIPILEYFDREKFTRRAGDKRLIL